MGFIHRHRWLTPYLLLVPGLAWLALFFVVPLGFLGHQSLETGSIDFGYAFRWAWHNYWDAIRTYHGHIVRSFEYAGLATVLAILVSYPLTSRRAGICAGIAPTSANTRPIITSTGPGGSSRSHSRFSEVSV